MRLVLGFLLGIGITGIVTGRASIAAAAAPALFADAPAPEPPLDPALLPPSLRTRHVHVDFALLAEEPAALRLNLFADVDVTAEATEVTRSASGSLVWKGRIGDDGSVALVARDASIAASVELGARRYVVVSARGVYVVVEEDPDAPKGGDDLVADALAQAPEAIAAQSYAAFGAGDAVLDVLLLYTSFLAVNQSRNDIQMRAELRIDDLNEVFQNSAIPARARLVHVGEVVEDEHDFASGGNGRGVGALWDPDDGRMDEAHVMRDVYAADLVQLWSVRLPSSTAGVAHSIAIDEREPFSVVRYSEAGNFDTVSHEFGHSMGCDHNRDDAHYGSQPDRYNYGYAFFAGGSSYGDIMSYDGSPIRHYANPDVLFAGVPTGIAHPDPNGQSADCARAIRENLPALEAYRDAPALVPGSVVALIDDGETTIRAFSQYGGVSELLFAQMYWGVGAWDIAASDDGATLYVVGVNPPDGHTLVRIDGDSGAEILGDTLPFEVGALTMGSDGFLYDAAVGASCVTNPGAILKIDPANGAVVGSWQGDEICKPAGVAFAANGDLLVAEPCHAAGCSNLGSVIRVRPGDGFQSVVASDPLLNAPEAMTATGDGDVVLVTRAPVTGRGRLVRVDVETGTVTLLSDLFEDFYGGVVVGADGDAWIAAGAGLWRFDADSGSLALVAEEETRGAMSVALVAPRLPACADVLDQDGDGAAGFPSDPGCRSLHDPSETFDCADGLDGDADGAIDFPADPGCTSADDPDERGTVACDDGVDDDNDGVADHPLDPGCADLLDDSEHSPLLPCDNGVDDDGDYRRDFPLDPGCIALLDPSEREPSRICDDGIDNDGDGRVDYPDDPGCGPGDDPSEKGTRVCDDALDNDGDGAVDTNDAGCTGPGDRSEEFDCQDGIDNDGDGSVDHPSDAGCWAATSPKENPQCSNELDDDGDGRVDHDGGFFGVEPDPHCVGKPYRDSELPPGCGLGVEIALSLLVLQAMRRRSA